MKPATNLGAEQRARKSDSHLTPPAPTPQHENDVGRTQFDRLLEAVTISLFSVMLISVLLQVLFRYVLQISVMWTEELARLMAVWVTFLGAAVVMRLGGHMNVDFLVQRIPPRPRAIVSLLFTFVMMLFLLTLLRGALDLMGVTWETRAASMRWFRMAYAYLPVALSSVIMTVYLGGQLVRGVCALRNPEAGVSPPGDASPPSATTSTGASEGGQRV